MRGPVLVRLAAPALVVLAVTTAASASSSAGWMEQDLSSARFSTVEAYSINDRGQAIGSGTREWEYARSFVWQSGTLVDLGRVAAVDINGGGQVAGTGVRNGRATPFLWERGRIRYLGSFGGAGAAVALDDGGRVVGWSATRTSAHHAFLWQRGRLRDLGTLGGVSSEATAVNAHGQVVGWSQVRSGARHAFLWSGGRMHDLGTVAGAANSQAVAINAHAQVVGFAYSRLDGWKRPAAPLAVVWRDGKATRLGRLSTSDYGRPSSPVGYPIAINDQGQVAGSLADGDHESRAFRWEKGRLTYLPALPGALVSGALDIDERGQIVGWSALTRDATAGTHAVIWENGAVTDLHGSSTPDESHVVAAAINEHDQIVGSYSARMESPKALYWSR